LCHCLIQLSKALQDKLFKPAFDTKQTVIGFT